MINLVDSAHGGVGWEERETTHINELSIKWSNCGVTSEYHQLKNVLLRRPGKEIENIPEPEKLLWTERMEPTKARYQHDELVDTYKKFGVTVEYLEDERATNFPNIIYIRDLFSMTPQGAIISRLASKVRSGEENIISKKIANMGIPIIASAHNDMVLEGPDILIVNQDLVFLGVGLRTNIQAVNFVNNLLKIQGFEEIEIIQTTYGCGHLDGVVNILNSKNSVIIPQRASFQLYSSLKKHGFNIIELCNMYEIDELMSINFVTLNDETVLINKGCQDTIQKYAKAGVESIEVDVSELTKGGGSVHCMTGVLKRG
ncbi:dimethylarginine dimethylaminohydrolase family protein [Halalkalibacter sp. APA_J-10(15)]|uniref:dimethylarginine dimethylaminohydrolase family protein n=1 Tax=Halalkalibacter sp. APA_J-10(15) TaxID=2933805 RepID=UPI001FF65927|nr:arginine deiminase family protein [Halalkalibacter sp. APA_J-10(15)]MCK0473042.1 arginine deiminase family protein [Halalkalibacter sp. APA_J-10(15)]